jgi:pyruvate formate lyase activating enzyme
LGVCRVRRNDDGVLVSLVYGKCVSMNADPIEKKPLFHFLPGTRSMSMATIGCNFRCRFCQNCEISQAAVDGIDIPWRWTEPREIVETAVRQDCASVSYTYTEPTIFFEYALDTARLARRSGLANCFVSNGYMTPEAIEMIRPWLDAINVDLKSFRDETYRQFIGARLEPVLDSIRAFREAGVWIELTTLIVPGMNDSEEELRDIARFIAGLDPNIPWHVSRFFPRYQMNGIPPTPEAIMRRAFEMGTEEGLRFVYCGNIMMTGREDTRCPQCGTVVIERTGRSGRSLLDADGSCPDCKNPIPGVWTAPRAG